MTDTASQHKVQLLIRTRELSAMKQVLLYVQSLPHSKREEWVATNGEEMSMAFQQFMSISEHTLKNMELDQESVKLSFDLVQELRDTEQLVQAVFGETTTLIS